MGIFVKICGIARAQDAAAVAKLSPDGMGFVLWEGSKRPAKPREVGKWIKDLPATIKKVGVFVNATVDDLHRVLEVANLNVVQLHGTAPDDVYEHVDCEVWRAIHLDRDDAAEFGRYHVDAFLVDSYTPESPGGTGKTNDWKRARRFVEESSTPVLLAGGLTPENVDKAIRQVKPWGVDVSSGVEAEPGIKDITRVKDFIEACRRST